MRDRLSVLKALARDSRGNIAISAALVSPLFIGALALGVDYGSLTLQQRELQQAADLAAIAAAANLSDPEKATLEYFQMNGLDIPVATAKGLLTDQGLIAYDPNETPGVVATVTPGRYTADPAISVAARFVRTRSYADAARVEIHGKGQLFFANAFTEPPTLGAVGTAAANKVAAFSIGSRLASLHDGILNAVLSGLIGTTVDLDLMDYRALLDCQVNALGILDALAINLGLTALTYDELLQTEISYGSLLRAILATPGLDARSKAAIEALVRTASKTRLTLHLTEIIGLEPLAENLVGSSNYMALDVGVFDILTAAASAANEQSQIDLDLGAKVPGLASAKLSLAIGEPAIVSPKAAIGAPGTIIRTAQTRLALEISSEGLLALAGVKVKVPFYLEVAHAEARLANIRCQGVGKEGNVQVEAVPGIVELALGEVNTKAFANFGTTPRVSKATLVAAPLLGIDALAYANASNIQPKTLTFTASDIRSGTIKTISTSDTLTSLQTSLLKNLDLDVRLGPLSLSSPKAIQTALSDTLSALTVPLDKILYNTLLTLGIRVGETDIRVTDARCMQSVLVQ
ncbi:pilus assembly protein TadG-related protein [Rhizobium sp. SL42]|uniref:pilus assembly protein TadG-related protein n=1 Tax=Rhizobium sp. SL42 TaxID=2806346 RepID=UPI001F379EDE|nr:pilus assembly protein TadG-related protein [Rhizobium sp. SL42]UJW74011.1 hypothetical protein IM739_14100 [Rhizobium sp. SL42]